MPWPQHTENLKEPMQFLYSLHCISMNSAGSRYTFILFIMAGKEKEVKENFKFLSVLKFYDSKNSSASYLAERGLESTSPAFLFPSLLGHASLPFELMTTNTMCIWERGPCSDALNDIKCQQSATALLGP